MRTSHCLINANEAPLDLDNAHLINLISHESWRGSSVSGLIEINKSFERSGGWWLPLLPAANIDGGLQNLTYSPPLKKLIDRSPFGASTTLPMGSAIAADNLEALIEAEKAAGIEPDPHVAAFMKANTLEGKAESIHTEFILHILGLNVCADTLVSSRHAPIPD